MEDIRISKICAGTSETMTKIYSICNLIKTLITCFQAGPEIFWVYMLRKFLS